MQRKMNPEEDHVPLEKLSQLTTMEQLLVRTYRCWIAGMRLNNEYHWDQAWSAMSEHIGLESTRRVLSGLQNIIMGIGTSARRPIRLHPPCCGLVCPDELALLTLVGACQRQERRLTSLVAEWIVTKHGNANLLEGSQVIANELLKRDIHLPKRSGVAKINSEKFRNGSKLSEISRVRVKAVEA
tara:strand:+ start:97613 stop:98164 length:552 start_codon:yes stop_codon:yes gene_type:complete